MCRSHFENFTAKAAAGEDAEFFWGISGFQTLFWGDDDNNKSVQLEYVIYSAPLHFVFLCVHKRTSHAKLSAWKGECLAFKAICASDSVVFVSDGRCLRQASLKE